jgi:hypothetical protein
MPWTKQELVLAAFSRIGYGTSFDISPEAIEDATRKMDMMVATWSGSGINIGYNISSTPKTTNSTDNSGVPDAYNETLYLNLAKRIAGEYGKRLSPEDLSLAHESYLSLLNKAVSANTIPMQYPKGMPRGAGNKEWRNKQPFVTPPVDPLETGPEDNFILE